MRVPITLALAAALLAAGCGLQPPERSATQNGPSSEPTPVPGAPVPVQPTATPTPGPQGPAAPPAPFPGYALAWSDEFDGTALDTSRWRVDTGVRRSGYNTPDAVSVANGAMRISVTTQAGVHRSGFLSSEGAFSQTYGYYEARIRFTDAPGEWCAFWLLSPTIGQPIGNPAIAGTEIDIVEHRFTDDSGWQLADWVSMNLNWDGYGPNVQRLQHVTQLPGKAPVQGQWHVYGVLWQPDAYTFYVDGTPLFRTSQAVSQRSEFIQLTCEVDDQSWAGAIPPGGYPPSTGVGMDVDWVRAWRAP